MKATINVPENLNEISLKQYQRFLQISELMEGDMLNQKMVSIFCSIPFRDSLMIKRKDIVSTANEIGALFEKEQELQRSFKIGKVEFGFIPSLEDITAGEFSDLDTYLGDWKEMHKAMAVLFRPITKQVGDKYLIEDYEGSDKYSEIMQFAPLGAVMGAVVFFYHLSKELANYSLASLQEDLLQEASTEQLINLVKSGDGTEASML